ncbi:hypothetical protein F5Y02DRAFT_337681 [Annulohypoxylon stygium]|nr:hypothetical protein F5Y02DRAFT_337681 [Annulohypoxylon stygium]
MSERFTYKVYGNGVCVGRYVCRYGVCVYCVYVGRYVVIHPCVYTYTYACVRVCIYVLYIVFRI